ncbi:ABC transporter permease [Algoriphagus halophytocola]|uniref:ABC transporter permease n=1 Tax=Algoriphagus halophytocola TaxID=2991499 RepID=A0ABY6MQ91_9BACT|nr:MULTISPECIES: ABC transporter permease [unclassified Algoriphagus]UZD24789.1 ABC transporter permease [Algoriphagus sp. TR-M5]WBL45096.1 ABC transporter permease [Algoriphagus sp. TR-M9]
MWKNYLLVAYRNLLKHKVFSAINLFGLALGMTASLIIIQYVCFEFSYDRFHENSDRIYRVQHDRYIDGELQYQKAQSFIPTGEAMMNEYSEVEDYTTMFRISNESDIVVTHLADDGEMLRFSEKEVYHVKGGFFEVFSFPFIEGNDEIKQLEPQTAMISQSTAKKYFGNESAIGKVISHNYAKDYTVVGVFEDIPENAHMKFDFLFAWQEVTSQDDGGDDENWRWDGFYTYLLLTPDADIPSLESKFPAFAEKYIAGTANNNVKSAFTLQPLTSIHLNSDLLAEAEANNELKIVYALLTVAIFVMLIAWINFINLSISRSLERSKEVGVRKVTGSGRSQLIKQFLTESLVMNLLAFSISCIFLYLLAPYISYFIGGQSTLSLFSNSSFILGTVLTITIGSALAGLYPAFITSSLKPILALKGNYSNQNKGSFFSLKHSLIVFQFVLSITLIAASTVAYRQLSLMKTSNLGIDIESTIVVNTQATFGPPGSDSVFTRRLTTFRDKLNANEKIQGITASHDIPGKEHLSLMPNFRHSKNIDELVTLYFTRMDFDFIPTFGVDLVAGRNFIEGVDNQYAMILNKEAVQILGYENPEDAIGREVNWGNRTLAKAEIVGVVDFRAVSYKESNYPIAYTSTFFPYKYVSVKFDEINGANAEEHVALIQNTWNTVFPDKPFEYFFLDDFFNAQYKADQKFGQLLGAFTLLALVVAGLGLYGITLLTVTQRIKEVGLRKIMGASVSQIIVLLSKQFLFMVIIAGLISIPVIKLSMEKWLENYPYRIEMYWWIYLLPIALILVITCFTVGFQIIKASLINPAKLLRYE